MVSTIGIGNCVLCLIFLRNFILILNYLIFLQLGLLNLMRRKTGLRRITDQWNVWVTPNHQDECRHLAVRFPQATVASHYYKMKILVAVEIKFNEIEFLFKK